jgi:hypothetical protein
MGVKKMKLVKFLFAFSILISLGLILGCEVPTAYTRAQFAVNEPPWIREGQPIIYNNQNWYPSEEVENFTDGEMEYVATYNDAPFYVEKRQVKPFNRIYTKFGYHKYRIFLKR